MTVDEFLFIDTTRQKRDEVCFQVYFVIFTRFFIFICINLSKYKPNKAKCFSTAQQVLGICIVQ
jgi:hypothetical protein